MGNNVSHFLQSSIDTLLSYWASPRVFLLLGIDGAGKTTMLSHFGAVVDTTPTIAFHVQTCTYKNINFSSWDVDSYSRIRPFWKFYFQGCDAVIFVVDAADRGRIDEAAHELRAVFQHEELHDTKLLVFANKQDHPDCMKIDELRERLNLPSITKNASHIVGTVATTGTGVCEGLDWLAKAITGK